MESSTNITLSLAKVMVAAAWADGQINNDEINCLKDILFHLEGMTASDWAEIDIYIESPVDEAERQRLVTELQARLSSPTKKESGLSRLWTRWPVSTVWSVSRSVPFSTR